MAREYYRFFNSATDDARSYDADDLAAAFRALALSGVAALDEFCLKVSAEGGTMRTLVGYGSAVLKGYHYELRDDGGAATAYTHAASASYDRIDRIILRLDLAARTIGLLKREGVAAAQPAPPSLTRTESVYELSLASVRVRDSATEIAPLDVTDERADESVCGAALPEGVALSRLWERMAKRAASASADGLMSAGDKSRLDALNAALTPNAQQETLDLGGYTLTGGEMRYGEDGTVSGAIAALQSEVNTRVGALESDAANEGTHVYEYSYNSVERSHQLNGTGSLGRAYVTHSIFAGEEVRVNGAVVSALGGGEALAFLPGGQWATFVYDAERNTINFKTGGGATSGIRLMLAPSLDSLPAVAPNTVAVADASVTEPTSVYPGDVSIVSAEELANGSLTADDLCGRYAIAIGHNYLCGVSPFGDPLLKLGVEAVYRLTADEDTGEVTAVKAPGFAVYEANGGTLAWQNGHERRFVWYNHGGVLIDPTDTLAPEGWVYQNDGNNISLYRVSGSGGDGAYCLWRVDPLLLVNATRLVSAMGAAGVSASGKAYLRLYHLLPGATGGRVLKTATWSISAPEVSVSLTDFVKAGADGYRLAGDSSATRMKGPFYVGVHIAGSVSSDGVNIGTALLEMEA